MVKQIPLFCGKHSIIDDEDFEVVSKFKWHLQGKRYAGAHFKKNKKSIHIKLHRLIMNPPNGFEIDHINGDKLDNRRLNLRICTRAENSRNRKKFRLTVSKYKGVSRPPGYRGWVASIGYNGKQMKLGSFQREIYAAMAYNAAASILFGEYASLNIIQQENHGKLFCKRGRADQSDERTVGQ